MIEECGFDAGRRRALTVMGATLAAAALPVGSRTALRAQEVEPERRDAALAAGPMIGHVSETGIAIWLQTRRPARVELVGRLKDRPDAVWRSEAETREAEACFARLDLEGLPFGADVVCEIAVAGKTAGPPLLVRTQEHWRGSAAPELTIAFGSCAYVNDPRIDGDEEPYGGDTAIFRSIAAQRPDLMLWLGDNVYFRDPDCSSRRAMFARYAHARAVADLQPLLRACPNYAIWDDHDYGPNDSDWTFRSRDDALAAFRAAWANPSYGLPELPGVFTRFTVADVELFLTDGRYHRSPKRLPKDDDDKVLLGRTQMRWLLDALTSSNARFKIVACGSQLMNPVAPYEAWSDFEKERQRFLDEVTRRNVRGLLFLTGDRHHAELIRLGRTSSYALHDFTSSPLLSRVHQPDGRERDNPARVEGTLIEDARNFGLIRVKGPAKARELVLEARTADGALRWSHGLAAGDLGW